MKTITPLTPDQRALVEGHLDLAGKIATTVWRKNPDAIDRDDLLGVAYEGLVTAASRFDPERANVNDGVRDIEGAFTAFASTRIRGEILDWQRSRDHVSRNQRSTYKALQSHGYGAGRTPEELSDLTGMDEIRVRLVIAAVESTPVSIFSTVVGNELDHEPAEPKHSRRDDESVEQSALASRIQDAVTEMFDSLSDFQRLVIALRYYEGLDLTTIATVLETGLTQVRVAHSEAVLYLHAAMVSEAS